MSRSVTIGAILLTATVSFGLYRLSYEVQREEDELGAYNRAILHEREAIQVLHAEWSYLTRPAALQERAARNLNLEPLLPSHIVHISDLPDRLPGDGESGSGDTPALPVPLPKPKYKQPALNGPATVAHTPAPRPTSSPAVKAASDTVVGVPVLASAKVQ